MASLPVRHYVHISRQYRISLLESFRPAVSDARLLRGNAARERSGTVDKALMAVQRPEAPGGLHFPPINLCVRWTQQNNLAPPPFCWNRPDDCCSQLSR